MALRVQVCRVDEVPDTGVAAFPVEGIDVPIMVTRIDGTIRALTSMCPHEDVSLVDGDVVGGRIQCPGHAYEFDLATGQCSHDPSLVARVYRVTVIGEHVYVDLIS